MPRGVQRIMIMGQPGAGKSWLARELGRITGLPVVHMDRIHWMPGWVERPLAEKVVMAHAVEAGERWIFEGGLSATYENRASRAELIVWLDLPVWLRLWRVTRRSLRDLGRSRPDLPENCPEKLSNLPEFWGFIWRTRRSGRERVRRLTSVWGERVPVVRLRSRAGVDAWLRTFR